MKNKKSKGKKSPKKFPAKKASAAKAKRPKPKTNVDIFFDGKDASLAQITNAIKLVQIRPIILDAPFRKKLAEKLGIKEPLLLEAAKRIIAGLKKRR